MCHSLIPVFRDVGGDGVQCVDCDRDTAADEKEEGAKDCQVQIGSDGEEEEDGTPGKGDDDAAVCEQKRGLAADARWKEISDRVLLVDGPL